jgi:murein DD-endopeptidase MepM/ murein hydrolase activator NlpD
MRSPIDRGYLTIGYSGIHRAVDIGWNKLGLIDPSVIAWAKGIVVASKYDLKAGHMIIIRHEWNQTHCIVSRYLHLKTRSVYIGDQVKDDQRIGIGGTTGSTSSGNHLHFELWLMPIAITKYTIEMRDLYAFDPRSMISTNRTNVQITGEGFHMISLKESYALVKTESSILNARLYPSLKSPIVTQLVKDKSYTCLGTTNEIDGYTWAKVIDGDHIVYVASKYLIFSDPFVIHSKMSDGRITVEVNSNGG